MGQDDLDPEPARRQAGGTLPITSTLMGVLDALERAYPALGLDAATRVDEVFAQLVLARIIDPIGKLDACGYSRSRRCVGGLPDPEAALAHPREGCVAAEAVRRMRCPPGPGTSQPGGRQRIQFLALTPIMARCRRATIFQ